MLREKLQAVIDAEVAGSPRARTLLGELEGRSMRIVARYTPWKLVLLAEGGRLQLLRALPAGRDSDSADNGGTDHVGGAGAAEAGAADVTLSGTPLNLLALLREEPTAVIRRGDVRLTGDGEAGQRFQELALLLRPQLEEALSRVIGDMPAWGVGSLLRKALDYGRVSATTQADNIGEYLAHERGVLVPRAEAQQFLDDVDTLRESTDRLEARVTQLEAQGRRE